MTQYFILFGKKPESKDLRDPRAYTELYRTETSGMSDFDDDSRMSDFDKKYREFESKGYTLKTIIIKVDKKLELDETLELKITKSALRPSSKETLGCGLGP